MSRSHPRGEAIYGPPSSRDLNAGQEVHIPTTAWKMIDTQARMTDCHPPRLSPLGRCFSIPDGAELVQRLGEHGDVQLRFLEYCEGAGSGSGACRVADQYGHVFFLSSIPGDEANRAQHARSMTVLERLWSMGHPAPHYEQVVDLGDLLVIIQREAQGVPPIGITRSLVDRLLDLLSDRASLMGEDSDAGPLSLYLLEEAPSHHLLREHSDRTRQLLDWIEGVGSFYGDTLPGPDAVHFDYQPGNVLVHPNRPDEVTAIVDWGGGVASSGGFDLVTLAWNSFGPAGEREVGVDEYLWGLVRQLPEPILVPSWAHLSLRLIYWAIRNRPESLGHWLRVSERLTGEGSLG
jgi:hypothetical protein